MNPLRRLARAEPPLIDPHAPPAEPIVDRPLHWFSLYTFWKTLPITIGLVTLVSLLPGVIALLIIIAFGLFGIFADIALIANLVMLLALMSFFGFTLTLPGIAGIVLTMGMAVDSNVLIFERVREEWRNGRTAINAIESGFKAALGTILDANLTTLIAAAVLFGVGSGPIRGFAVTLSIGIITTVFTAFTLTQLIIALWVKAKRPKEVPL